MADSNKYDKHARHTNLTLFKINLVDGMMIPGSQCYKTHLRVWFSDVRAARAVGRAGSGQGRA